MALHAKQKQVSLDTFLYGNLHTKNMFKWPHTTTSAMTWHSRVSR